jgi:hypothetical protein
MIVLLTDLDPAQSNCCQLAIRFAHLASQLLSKLDFQSLDLDCVACRTTNRVLGLWNMTMVGSRPGPVIFFTEHAAANLVALLIPKKKIN